MCYYSITPLKTYYVLAKKKKERKGGGRGNNLHNYHFHLLSTSLFQKVFWLKFYNSKAEHKAGFSHKFIPLCTRLEGSHLGQHAHSKQGHPPLEQVTQSLIKSDHECLQGCATACSPHLTALTLHTLNWAQAVAGEHHQSMPGHRS